MDIMYSAEQLISRKGGICWAFEIDRGPQTADDMVSRFFFYFLTETPSSAFAKNNYGRLGHYLQIN